MRSLECLIEGGFNKKGGWKILQNLINEGGWGGGGLGYWNKQGGWKILENLISGVG